MSDKARAFGWSASLIATTMGVHETPRWWNMPAHLDNGQPCTHQPWIETENGKEDGLCRACRYVRSEFDRVWRAKMVLGSHVHHLALSWAKGESVDTDDTTEPYLDALEKFYEEHVPEFVELERTIRYVDDMGLDRDYRGQFDFIAHIDFDHQLGLWDIKTGSFHPVEQTLQLAGYRYATYLTRWETNDKGRPVELADEPMPEVEEAGVLMLGDDGNYQLIPLLANQRAHSMFLKLREAWGWARGIERWDTNRKKAEAAA